MFLRNFSFSPNLTALQGRQASPLSEPEIQRKYKIISDYVQFSGSSVLSFATIDCPGNS
jgi:hypothetical protein